MVQGQPGQTIPEIISRKYPTQKKGWWSGSQWYNDCLAKVRPSKHEAPSSNANTTKKVIKSAWYWWLKLAILATWEAEIGRIVV
jgi:hypothetical protein